MFRIIGLAVLWLAPIGSNALAQNSTGKILALPQPPSASVATMRVEIWGSTIKEAEALAV
jgi:hypothetical protein